MKLGTYTTLDTPTDPAKAREALEYLREQFAPIGGRVRAVLNPHDFGSYPSFEIDHPADIDTSDESQAAQERADEWIEATNAIEAAYSDKYADYL